MKIFDKRSGKVICSNVALAKTFFSRFKGLMFSSKKNLLLEFENEGTWSASIHMMFMNFPIDAIWISRKKKIVNIQRNILPFSPFKSSTWKIYKPKKPAKYILELSTETLNKEIKEGDEVEFTEK